MPSLKLHINESYASVGVEGLLRRIKEVWDELGVLMDDAVMSVKHEPIWHGRNAKPCYLEVRASVGTPIQDVLKIANAFLGVVDVECDHPEKGTMRWHPERGRPFREYEWDKEV